MWLCRGQDKQDTVWHRGSGPREMGVFLPEQRPRWMVLGVVIWVACSHSRSRSAPNSCWKAPLEGGRLSWAPCLPRPFYSSLPLSALPHDLTAKSRLLARWPACLLSFTPQASDYIPAVRQHGAGPWDDTRTAGPLGTVLVASSRAPHLTHHLL